MNVSYVTYNPDTGRIYKSGTCPLVMILLQDDDVLVGSGSDHTHYVNVQTLKITPRPENPATLNGMVINDLPNGATLTIEGEDYRVTDGTAELSFEHPGTYKVQVSAFPYLDKVITVENPA